MSKYRMARRSFFRGLGAGAAGVAGLKTLLRTMEASAAGTPPPPRFLMTHWPVGTQKYWFCPVTVGSDPNPALPALPTIAPNGTNWDFSRILKPFGDAGLKSDMIVLYNLNSGSVGSFGGGHEAGTPQSSTGARTPGTRSNGGETDDAVSGGPSWDQIFLKTVAQLQTPGVGYVNAICDARVDSQETSTQCLSYDYKTQSTPAAQGGNGGSVTENIPLLPILSPLSLFTKLFMNVSGGGGGGADTARLLKARKSVLDCARGQLGAAEDDRAGQRGPQDRHPRRRDPEDRRGADDADQQRRHHAPVVHAAGDARRRAGGQEFEGQRRLPERRQRRDDGHRRRQRHPRADRQGSHGDPQGRVRLRPDPRRHLPVVAGNEPRVVQGAVPEQPEQHLHAPPEQPPDQQLELVAAEPVRRVGAADGDPPVLGERSDLVQHEDGRHPQGLEGHDGHLRRQPAGQHDHPVHHRGRREQPLQEQLARDDLRGQRAGDEGRPVPAVHAVEAAQRSVDLDRAGLLQDDDAARQSAGDQRRRHREHLRPQRRQAHLRACGRRPSARRATG